MTRSGYGPGEARGAAGTNRCGRVGRSASGIGGVRWHRGPGAVLGAGLSLQEGYGVSGTRSEESKEAAEGPENRS